ncbi:MAG: AAA family ATPase [Fimbriimonadales bacterium]|nr:MAG: chromosome segregation protein SMC [Fimbriimonadales bacterium]
MPHSSIHQLQVKGFLSIRDAVIEFRRINLLLGANGAGKSNLLRLFQLLQSLTDDALQEYVARAGGANALLHYGRKQTDEIAISLQFERSQQRQNTYYCRLIPTADDSLKIAEEHLEFQDRKKHSNPYTMSVTYPHAHSVLARPTEWFAKDRDLGLASHVRDCIRAYRVYHFHDTSESARIMQRCYIYDNQSLHADAGNLAAVLLRLREEHRPRYDNLIDLIRLAAPFLGEFVLEPIRGEYVLLRWRERGWDTVFSPHALSDGTLRFIALATLLSLPDEWRPATVIIDEPELGLHPYAINLLASAIRSAAQRTQFLISTQSPLLVSNFEPEDVIVAERIDGATVFRRLERQSLEVWLDAYSLGEIWEKNLIGGRPTR